MTQAQTPAQREEWKLGHIVLVEPSPKWIRGMVNGQLVVDSKRALLLRETSRTPVYCFPIGDVRWSCSSRQTTHLLPVQE